MADSCFNVKLNEPLVNLTEEFFPVDIIASFPTFELVFNSIHFSELPKRTFTSLLTAVTVKPD